MTIPHMAILLTCLSVIFALATSSGSTISQQQLGADISVSAAPLTTRSSFARVSISDIHELGISERYSASIKVHNLHPKERTLMVITSVQTETVDGKPYQSTRTTEAEFKPADQGDYILPFNLDYNDPTPHSTERRRSATIDIELSEWPLIDDVVKVSAHVGLDARSADAFTGIRIYDIAANMFTLGLSHTDTTPKRREFSASIIAVKLRVHNSVLDKINLSSYTKHFRFISGQNKTCIINDKWTLPVDVPVSLTGLTTIIIPLDTHEAASVDIQPGENMTISCPEIRIAYDINETTKKTFSQFWSFTAVVDSTHSLSSQEYIKPAVDPVNPIVLTPSRLAKGVQLLQLAITGFEAVEVKSMSYKTNLDLSYVRLIQNPTISILCIQTESTHGDGTKITMTEVSHTPSEDKQSIDFHAQFVEPQDAIDKYTRYCIVGLEVAPDQILSLPPTTAFSDNNETNKRAAEVAFTTIVTDSLENEYTTSETVSMIQAAAEDFIMNLSTKPDKTTHLRSISPTLSATRHAIISTSVTNLIIASMSPYFTFSSPEAEVTCTINKVAVPVIVSAFQLQFDFSKQEYSKINIPMNSDVAFDCPTVLVNAERNPDTHALRPQIWSYTQYSSNTMVTFNQDYFKVSPPDDSGDHDGGDDHQQDDDTGMSKVVLIAILSLSLGAGLGLIALGIIFIKHTNKRRRTEAKRTASELDALLYDEDSCEEPRPPEYDDIYESHSSLHDGATSQLHRSSHLQTSINSSNTFTTTTINQSRVNQNRMNQDDGIPVHNSRDFFQDSDSDEEEQHDPGH